MIVPCQIMNKVKEMYDPFGAKIVVRGAFKIDNKNYLVKSSQVRLENENDLFVDI